MDLSSCSALKALSCSFNQLECLNIKNGNNINFEFNTNSAPYFYASVNPNLTCIEVDWVVWANQNLYYNIDPSASFSENCNNACSSTTSLVELTTSKNINKILDMLGRETSFKPNTPLIYVYDDGSTEKVFSVEY